MAELQKTTCCGVRQFVGLEDCKTPEEALLKAGNNWFLWNGAFILFTCVVKCKLADELIAYIKKNKLGDITEGPEATKMRMFSWGVDKNKFKSWAKANCGFKTGNLIKHSKLAQGRYYYNTEQRFKVSEIAGCVILATCIKSGAQFKFPHDECELVSIKEAKEVEPETVDDIDDFDHDYD